MRGECGRLSLSQDYFHTSARATLGPITYTRRRRTIPSRTKLIAPHGRRDTFHTRRLRQLMPRRSHTHKHAHAPRSEHTRISYTFLIRISGCCLRRRGWPKAPKNAHPCSLLLQLCSLSGWGMFPEWESCVQRWFQPFKPAADLHELRASRSNCGL